MHAYIKQLKSFIGDGQPEQMTANMISRRQVFSANFRPDQALVNQRGAQEIVSRGHYLARLEMAQKAYLGITIPGFCTFSLLFSPAKQVMPLGLEDLRGGSR